MSFFLQISSLSVDLKPEISPKDLLVEGNPAEI